VLAAAAALAVTAAAARAVIRRRRSLAATPRPPARRPVSCACGQEYVVAGTDRHRIYWPAGAAEADPVLGDNCPVCQAPLPLPVEREPAEV
jgi:hypothetical protein